jgi:hypothetical protein
MVHPIRTVNQTPQEQDEHTDGGYITGQFVYVTEWRGGLTAGDRSIVSGGA